MYSIARACREAKIGPTSRQVIFLLEADQSNDDIRGALHDAIKTELPTGTGYWVWVVEVWDDRLVYEYETPDGTKIFERQYTITEDGEVTLESPIEVERVTDFVPVNESDKKQAVESAANTEIKGAVIQLIESSVRPDGTVPIKLIEPGWGSSCYYEADVLERDGPSVFPRGTHMGWDHMTDAEEDEKPEGALDDLAAVLECDAHWEPNHPNGPGLYADAKVFGPFDEKLEEMAPFIGTSIFTPGIVEADQYGNVVESEREGRTGPILKELKKDFNTSVDFVTRPGAGGAVLQLFESLRPKKKDVPKMPDTELHEAKDKLKASEEKVVELEEGVVSSEADKAELDTFREAELKVKATDIVTASLKDVEMPETSRVRVIKAAVKDLPMKDGELDTEALEASGKTLATEEAEYLENLGGAGTVRGMGGNGEEDEDHKKLEEAVRRRHPDFSDEQVAVYCS